MDDETLRKIDLDQLQSEKEVIEEILSGYALPPNHRYLRERLKEINQTVLMLKHKNDRNE